MNPFKVSGSADTSQRLLGTFDEIKSFYQNMIEDEMSTFGVLAEDEENIRSVAMDGLL